MNPVLWQRVRRFALDVGLSLLGTFAIVMAVHFMLPMDPLDPEPLISYRLLFAIVFVVIVASITITHSASRRQQT